MTVISTKEWRRGIPKDANEKEDKEKREKRLTEAVHQYMARLYFQLKRTGRTSNRISGFLYRLSPFLLSINCSFFYHE